MDILDRIIATRPNFHAGVTEIQRSFEPCESLLPEAEARRLAATDLTCYAIGDDVMRFLAENVEEGQRTLETGAGCSTLVFAIRKARHTAITPSSEEIERIQQFGKVNDIDLSFVRFVPEASESYLPQSEELDLDLVLLDGKHAFPWPVIDWFFTADRLKKGGLMILDDTQMRSVSVLVDFMSADSGWKQLRRFGDKAVVFQKVRERVLDVTWHMQAWTLGIGARPAAEKDVASDGAQSAVGEL